jgi:hypothetical protein
MARFEYASRLQEAPMYVRSRRGAQFTESHTLIRTIAYLLAWAVLLATIGLIAAYLSPAPSGIVHTEEPGPLPSSAPKPVPTPAGPAALVSGYTVTLVSVVQGTSQASTAAY